MVKEIRFLVTGEVRRTKKGDWFLGHNNSPICAAQDFNTRYNQLPMSSIIFIECLILFNYGICDSAKLSCKA